MIGREKKVTIIFPSVYPILIPQHILNARLDKEGHFIFFFSFIFYIGVWLINNVEIVSDGQQSDSSVHIHVSFSPKLPSHSGLHITLKRAPCLCCRSLLVIFFKYSRVYVSPQHDIPYMQNLKSNDANKLIYERATDSQT